MSLQRRTLRIVRDVIGIVLDWNDRRISDKDAMKEITRSLLIHKDNNGKKLENKEEIESTEKNEVPELEKVEEEKKDEVKIKDEEKKEKNQVKKEKVIQNNKFGKKLVLPAIIGSFFILVAVGVVNPYDLASNFGADTPTEDRSVQLREIPSEDTTIKTEQFVKIPSETIERIQNNTVVLEP